MAHVATRILGPLETTVDGRRIDFRGRREQAVLGVLLLHAGEVVSIDALIDGVLGADPSPGARHLVHEYVSRLRSGLGDASLISTRAPGYIIERGACELDAESFAELVAAGRAAVDDAEALRRFDEALALWRGSVLGDLPLDGDARSAAARLEDERRAVSSERVELALGLGRHHQLIPELERAVAAEPLDEHLRGQLMLALYRDGRQADALARYREGRLALVEVGLEPGAELRALEQAILRHDRELRLETGVAARTGPRRRRAAVAAAAVAAVVAAGAGVVAAVATRGSASPVVRGNAVAVVDAASARIVGSVPLATPPGAIAAGAGRVWVSSPDSRSIERISPDLQRIDRSIPLGMAAQSIAVAGSSVWALGSGATDPYVTLERIDPTFGSVSRARRLPVVVGGDTGSLSARGGQLLVAPRTGLLTRIDARTGRILARADPNAAPSAAALGFGSAWLAYRDADQVVRVAPSGAVTPIPVGRGPSAIAVGERAVWVANALDGTVKSIDPATGAVITTITVGSNPTALATDGDSVWVASDDTLVRIDERTGLRTGTVELGGSPQSLVVADGKVWASVQTPPPIEPTGGTATVSVPAYVRTLDPADSFNGGAYPEEIATCATLLRYPDEAGPGGLRLVPDAARSLPAVSRDGLTYTFTIRAGMRFSPPSNQLVTAQTFKHAIERSLSPHMTKDHHPAGQLFLGAVVGAAAYKVGKAHHIAGIEARGRRLTIRVTERAPALPQQLTIPLFCAVPTDTPIRPVSDPIPSAGPYYVAAATPRRSFTLLRNPNYHGDRPHRLRRIEIVVGAQDPVAQIEASKLDYAIGPLPAGSATRLERLYGAHSAAARHGHQRFFAGRGLDIEYIALNTTRPLFAGARMRRAVAYAVDRRALAATGGAFGTAAVPAQMNLPPGIPGFRDRHIYPLVADVARARRLAGRGRHVAQLYCVLEGGGPQAAQVIKNNLAAIGIDVHIHCMPGDEFYTRLSRPNEPFDMDIESYGADYNDPGEFIDIFATAGALGFTAYDDPVLIRRIRAASRLSGLARAQAYAALDLTLTRDAVPRIVFANGVAQNFFSARIGCQLNQPVEGIDLAALCIKQK